MICENYIDETHSYFVGQERLPSVTELIGAAGLISEFSKQDWAAQRGTNIHTCCALLSQGKLDWNSVDERVIRYVEACEKYLNDMNFHPTHVEQHLYDPELGYAGTPDAWEGDLLIDYKSGSPAPYFGIQLAAYERLVGRFMRRMTVILNSNGTYSIKEHTKRTDWNIFRSCLNLWKFKEGRL